MTSSFFALSVSIKGVIGTCWMCCRVILNFLHLRTGSPPLPRFQDIFMCSVAAVETTAGIKLKSVKAIRQRQVELGIVAGMTGMDLGSDL